MWLFKNIYLTHFSELVPKSQPTTPEIAAQNSPQWAVGARGITGHRVASTGSPTTYVNSKEYNDNKYHAKMSHMIQTGVITDPTGQLLKLTPSSSQGRGIASHVTVRLTLHFLSDFRATYSIGTTR